MDRKAFFGAVRNALFAGKLTQRQVAGMNIILDAFDAAKPPIDHMAYMLATTFHETAQTMEPVRETLADTDDKAIGILESSWRRGRMPWVKSAYWRKDADGKSWLGRGLVQLTHKVNYDKIGKAIGVDLVADPSKAMDPHVAVSIMMAGMKLGIFTGKSLATYLDGVQESDAADFAEYTAARRIINGTDKASAVAGYAQKFEDALQAAGA